MALKDLETKKYYKIYIGEETEIDLMINSYNIILSIYKDINHREDGDSEFMKSYMKNVKCNISLIEIFLKYNWDENKNLINNILTAQYKYLKTLPDFKNFEDC